MDKRYKKSNSHDRERVKVPQNLNIKKSDEPGFDLETCMTDFKRPGHTFEQDADYYFDSYGHFGIHEEMLKDRTRTLAYKNAIMDNPQLFKDKIVLDVGCGTGILSIFAAKAGAKHVYGVEYASIAMHAKEIVKENGFADRITIIRGEVEEITLPVDKVDIIISEWMGYFLLYESMFDTVLYARDKWLNPDGILFPDRAIIYMAAIEDEEYKSQKIGFWDDVYGVNMGSVKKWALFEPLVDIVDRELINTESCPILDLDLKTIKAEDLNFASEYQLVVQRDDRVHALTAWFDVFFSHSNVPIRLSTSPYLKETHWKQTVFYINDILSVRKGDVISGSVAVKKCTTNPRELDIKISYNLRSQYHPTGISKTQYYRLC